MKLNLKKIFLLFFYLLYLVIVISSIMVSKNLEYDTWFTLIFWITISHIFITFLCFKSVGIGVFSISSIFVAISYVFHLGQVVLKGVANNYNYSFDVSIIIPEEIYKEAVIYSIVTISLVSVGVMLSNLIDCRQKTISFKGFQKKLPNKVLIKIGWIILLLTFPIEFYYSITKIIVSLKNGYADVLDVSSIGAISQFARFHLIGIALLIMGYSNQPKKSTLIFLLYAVYGVVTMLSGSRIYQIVSLLLMMYILFKSTNMKISFKKGSMIAILMLFLTSFLNAISDIRSSNSRDFDVVWTAFIDSLNNNPLYGALEEFGGTIYTVCQTILQVPAKQEHSHGLQFITNFVSAIPNVKGVFSEINSNSNFVLHLDTVALGGSYIAELYYSFEFIAYLVSLMIGILIGVVSKNLGVYLNQGRFYEAAYYIMPIFSLMIWVRGSSGVFVRNSIWGTCLIYIIYKLLVKRQGKIQNKTS
ncbi:O-antigen polysaccharide polymerase Wzy family protein [Peribacillus frigoritolerans]|uniref:O-antigen polysaccharide polymerase Wzy n=1 Tax=Peribacillus frigoritolerans TaxID=450367 RepID=UPI001EFC7419|nr:O-antigen polysaccharide polymerase Wzy [Peribacillus frigoritolerans]ULM95686.1 O-antigen polysaccharide polymerase Wzy family protein [Peribacillus frigoritolerans]